MKTILFDDSRWPLVLVRYSDHVDEDEFDTLLSLLDANIKRAMQVRAKTVLIYDSTSGYQASPRIRSLNTVRASPVQQESGSSADSVGRLR